MVSKQFDKNFITKDGWEANSPDLNPIWEHLEYHWRDNVQRSNPQDDERAEKATTLCMETLDAPKELAHSMPRRLENAIKNKGGYSGY